MKWWMYIGILRKCQQWDSLGKFSCASPFFTLFVYMWSSSYVQNLEYIMTKSETEDGVLSYILFCRCFTDLELDVWSQTCKHVYVAENMMIIHFVLCTLPKERVWEHLLFSIAWCTCTNMKVRRKNESLQLCIYFQLINSLEFDLV